MRNVKPGKVNGSGGCKICLLLSSLFLLSCRLICCVTVWVVLMYSQGGITANPLFGLELAFVVTFGSTALAGMVDIGQEFIFPQQVRGHSFVAHAILGLSRPTPTDLFTLQAANTIFSLLISNAPPITK